jgi:large subunit ribosomal protein L13
MRPSTVSRFKTIFIFSLTRLSVDLNKFDFEITGAAIVKNTPTAKDSDVQEVVRPMPTAILGRLACAASRLRQAQPALHSARGTGDFVIVINADKVRLTGKKWVQKVYQRHTGYIGGLKTTTARELMEKRPEELVRRAVKGMLPKNKLGSGCSRN